MNLYLLLEGKRTEKKLYQAWLEVFLDLMNRMRAETPRRWDPASPPPGRII
jgi:hypothetical protein